MTVAQSIGLAVLLTAVGVLASYAFRPRFPAVKWKAQVTPVLPGPIAGVEVQLDHDSVDTLVLVQIDVWNSGGPLGRDNTVRPLSIELSASYGVVKLAHSVVPEHITVDSEFTPSARRLIADVDNLTRKDTVSFYFLCSGAGPGISVGGAFRGMSGKPRRSVREYVALCMALGAIAVSSVYISWTAIVPGQPEQRWLAIPLACIFFLVGLIGCVNTWQSGGARGSLLTGNASPRQRAAAGETLAKLREAQHTDSPD